jgi:hypothetical protein
MEKGHSVHLAIISGQHVALYKEASLWWTM